MRFRSEAAPGFYRGGWYIGIGFLGCTILFGPQLPVQGQVVFSGFKDLLHRGVAAPTTRCHWSRIGRSGHTWVFAAARLPPASRVVSIFVFQIHVGGIGSSIPVSGLIQEA